MNSEYIGFVVGNESLCLWDSEHATHNREFLEGFDPYIYSIASQILLSELDEDNASDAIAVAIRLQYGLALETHFSMLCAAAQAPHAAYAWIPCCGNAALRAVVRRINGNEGLYSVWSTPITGWNSLRELFFPENATVDGFSSADYTALRDGYLDVWRRLATDFLTTAHWDEYNSSKHGSRTRAGSGSLLQITDGIDDSEGLTLGGDKHGARRFLIKKHPTLKLHHRILSIAASNWDPKIMCDRIDILAESVSAIRDCLLYRLDYKSVWDIRSISDSDIFDNALKPLSSLTNFEITPGYDASSDGPTKQEILDKHTHPTVTNAGIQESGDSEA